MIIGFTSLEEISSKRIDIVTEFTENSKDTAKTYEINTHCEYIFAILDQGPVFWDHRYSQETIQKYAAEKQKIAEKYGSTNYVGSWQNLPSTFWDEVKLVDEKMLKEEPMHYQVNPSLIEKYGGNPGFILTDNDIKEDPKCSKTIQERYPDKIQLSNVEP